MLPGAARAEEVESVPATTFAVQIAAAQRAVQACAANATACGAFKVPGREKVEGGPGGSFQVGWQWIEDALRFASTAPSKERAKAMQAASAHLTELAAEATLDGAVPSQEFGRARSAATAALARPEFRADAGPSWIERQIAKIEDWILSVFTGMGRLGARAPWLAPLIEWGCFGLAAAGLLWFVRQSLARQALRISLSESAALAGRTDRDAADWAHLAEERAASGDWREAVHCLYWAAIALMESRRAWKPNPTRTPREYLQLLQPRSDAQKALRALTVSFERVWYGLAEADESQYRGALGSFRALEAARPERAAPAPEDGGLTTALTVGGLV